MLRHTGEKRSYRHNIRLAVLLSLNAGFINAAGYLAFSVLTTNVTGHAALLAVYIAGKNLWAAIMVALWLCLFLLGAFSSGMYISLVGKHKAIAYTVPILFIIAILLLVAIFGSRYNHSLPQTGLFAGSLLFAMGMQNALVSMISGSVVRTTHLTGMFTDLGIDLSAMVLPGNKTNPAIKQRIILRLSIIGFFLTGGIIGGILFSKFLFFSFYVPVSILLVTLFYDYLTNWLSNTNTNLQTKI
ncbi:MAG: DUF1275 domain-containing protein [Taibaiella sp.]|nr:DUF1275 domain-containing protein [Taibaiella sp.]